MTTVPGTDWIEYFDEQHQRKYYYHPITKETIWNLPKAAKKAAKKATIKMENGEKIDLSPKYKDNVRPPKDPLEQFSPQKLGKLKEILSPRDKPKELVEQNPTLEIEDVDKPNGTSTKDENKNKKLENRKSRKERLYDGEDISLDTPESEKDGWIECTQEGTQKKYYYNIKSKRTTWIKPLIALEKMTDEDKLKAKPELLLGSYDSMSDPNLSHLKKKRSRSALVGVRDGDLISPREGMQLKPDENGDFVTLEGETQPRRNSESVYTQAKTIKFYNEQGNSIYYDSSLSEILDKADLSFLDGINISGNHSLTSYAKNNFQKQKTKVFIFKRELSPEAVVTWQKNILKSTLHSFNVEKDEKAALKLYQYVIQFTGRKPTTQKDDELFRTILELCVLNVQIRNEGILYAVKECNGNPNEDNQLKALQLLSAMVYLCPPTKPGLQEAVASFLLELEKKSKDKKIYPYILPAQKRLQRGIIIGPRKTTPRLKHCSPYMTSNIPLPIFGVPIEEYFAWQYKTFPGEEAPFILRLISKRLFEVDAFEETGIFRLPGDFEQIETIKDRFSEGDFDLDAKDPHVLASLFKLWLRELAAPLVPKSMYFECIKIADDRDKCIEMMMKLPQLNLCVVIFVIQFLSSILTDEFYQKTKMDTENISVVFTPNFIRNDEITNPKDIMQNAPREKLFVKNLILSAKPQ